jgi:diguanylate cyclase (GGDEF)-like protein
MRRAFADQSSSVFYTMMAQLKRPEWLVFLPAASLAAFWFGGEGWLMLVAIAAPVALALGGAFRFSQVPAEILTSGVAQRSHILSHFDQILSQGPKTGHSTACFVLQIDDEARLLDQHGRAAQAEILDRCADRISAALRTGDCVARLEGGGFAVALAATRRADIEMAVQLARRMQAAISAPISLNAIRIYVSVSVGFCVGSRAPSASGKALLDAAQIAADIAARHGAGTIRAFQPEMARHRADRDATRAELAHALDHGQICAYFQPQISTDAHKITGFEALARWIHPERGLVPPSEFLPLINDLGLSGRLGEVIIANSLTAMQRWEAAGHRIATVGVNFSTEELRDPKLVERLKWELDRYDLTPERLTIEILETVVAETDNDVIVRNVAALAELGCGIDLDDFGTGHASITSIRRFAVRRLKVDRSFVARVNEDREQQKMVSAILSMAKQLGLETLAEGVETTGEHSMLAQLGCGHVQGFGIARPMPFEDTLEWIEKFRGRRGNILRIGKTLG